MKIICIRRDVPTTNGPFLIYCNDTVEMFYLALTLISAQWFGYLRPCGYLRFNTATFSVTALFVANGADVENQILSALFSTSLLFEVLETITPVKCTRMRRRRLSLIIWCYSVSLLETMKSHLTSNSLSLVAFKGIFRYNQVIILFIQSFVVV